MVFRAKAVWNSAGSGNHYNWSGLWFLAEDLLRISERQRPCIVKQHERTVFLFYRQSQLSKQHPVWSMRFGNLSKQRQLGQGLYWVSWCKRVLAWKRGNQPGLLRLGHIGDLFRCYQCVLPFEPQGKRFLLWKFLWWNPFSPNAYFPFGGRKRRGSLWTDGLLAGERVLSGGIYRNERNRMSVESAYLNI